MFLTACLTGASESGENLDAGALRGVSGNVGADCSSAFRSFRRILGILIDKDARLRREGVFVNDCGCVFCLTDACFRLPECGCKELSFSGEKSSRVGLGATPSDRATGGGVPSTTLAASKKLGVVNSSPVCRCGSPASGKYEPSANAANSAVRS